MPVEALSVSPFIATPVIAGSPVATGGSLTSAVSADAFAAEP